ncbi:MAG: FAD-dependent oxidoreductase [Solirubrobacterales bacterium]
MSARAADVAVVGAGSFGAWTAWHLRRAGLSVLLLDAYGPANARASSGGESRIIRIGYGADELYSRSSLASLAQWKSLASEAGEDLFHETGVLWLAREGDPYATGTLATLGRLGVRHERMAFADLVVRYPQCSFTPGTWGMLEPQSGVLMARRAVQTVVRAAVKAGVVYRTAAIRPVEGAVTTTDGEEIRAGAFVFACGPWLPKVFPDILAARIFPTRQEVFFFGPPAGDDAFAGPRMPTWIDFGEETYGMPDLEGRGFKVAPDGHGPPIDPDTDERLVGPESVAQVRAFLGRRFPALAQAPLLETRVCQYENTSNGDFLIDRHPDRPEIWLVGGGSGHGFKHGPAVGERVAAQIVKGVAGEPRFSLATKESVQKRAVY